MKRRNQDTGDAAAHRSPNDRRVRQAHPASAVNAAPNSTAAVPADGPRPSNAPTTPPTTDAPPPAAAPLVAAAPASDPPPSRTRTWTAALMPDVWPNATMVATPRPVIRRLSE